MDRLSGTFEIDDRAKVIDVSSLVVAPGFIETDMTAAIDDKVRKKLYSQIPIGKPGSPRDVARTARFLAEDAVYVTGQVWTMDGGMS